MPREWARPLPPREEAIVVVLLGAPLVFPTVAPKVTVVAATGLLTLLAYQAFAGARTSRKSPLDWPWALFLFQAMVATATSPFPVLSVSRLACIVFGSLLLRALIGALRTSRDVEAAVWLYVVGGGVVGVGGLFGTTWPGFSDLERKISVLGPWARHIPQRLSGIPGAEAGFNANAMGAATLFFIPLLTAVFVRAMRQWAGPSRDAALMWPRLQAGVAGAALVPLIAVFVLTQSRTAWLALAVVAIAAGLWALRSTAAIAAVVVTAVLAIGVSGTIPAVLGQMTAPPPAGALIPLDTRPHLWARALRYVRDAPITGIGLDAFRIKGQELSPPFAGINKYDVHVHNVFLQTALDVGIPGLVAYVALLCIAAMMWRAVDRVGRAGERLVAVGVLGGILAVTIFGIYDAVAIGTKLSLCFWWSLGLLTALHQRVALGGDIAS